MGYGLAERRDAGGRAVFARRDRDINVSGLVEGIRYVVFNFGCALAEITPFLRVFLEAVIICFFGGPDNTAVERTSVIMAA